MNNCLIITDIQNDFCPGGALAVSEGDKVIPIINAISAKFDKVVATQDWHTARHVSFAQTHHKNPYDIISIDGLEQVLWPDHCVAGTFGADFHRDFDLREIDLIISKGNNPFVDSYSAFLENDKKTLTGLHYYLLGFGIKNIYLCGLATNYCVYFSALDAAKMGFQVTVLLDACRGVDVPSGSIDMAVKDMEKKGIRVLSQISVADFIPG